MTDAIFVGGPTIQQSRDLRAGPRHITGFQTQKGLLFEQLDAREIDSRFVIRASRTFVKLGRPRQLAALAIKIPVRFESLAKLPNHLEELTTFEGGVQMLFAFVHFTAI